MHNEKRNSDGLWWRKTCSVNPRLKRNQKVQNGQIIQTKNSQTAFYLFLCFHTCAAKSALNIKVSIYTGVVYTEQQGQKKVERTKGSNSRNFQKLATTLHQVLLFFV